ncbi:hypothetical protein MTO96_020885 [Rhipicephalus appendiculatus]
MCPLRRTASHGGQNVQRTLSSSLRRATEKTTAPKARQKHSAAGPGEPVTGFQRVKYSQAGERSVTPAGPPEQQLQGPLSLPGADPERAYLGGSCQAEASGAATRGNSGTIARA